MLFFLSLLLLNFSFADLVAVDLTKANSTLEDFLSYIGYNELSEQRRNMPVWYKRDAPTSLRFDTTLSTVQNRTVNVSITTPKRPQLLDMADVVWFMHDGNITSYNIASQPPQALLSSPLNGKFGDTAPFAYHQCVKDTKTTYDSLVTCLNGHLSFLKTDTLTEKISTTFDCGEYVSVGNDTIAVKNQSTVTLYSFIISDKSMYGEVEFLKTLSISDSSSSETFKNDAMRMTRYDNLYVIVSSHGKVSVFDKKRNFKTEDFITNIPFYSTNSSTYLSPLTNTPMDNIYSYGQIILVGTPGYGTSDLPYCGGGHLFFDNILDPKYSPRFAKILDYNGTSAYSYFGYSVGLSKNSAYFGGIHTIPSNFEYPSIQFETKPYLLEYCQYSECQCHSNWVYNNGVCVGNSSKSNVTLIVLLSLLSLFLLIGIVFGGFMISGVYWKKTHPKRKTKFRVGNFGYEFTLIDNFPLSLSTSELHFGCKDSPMPVNEERVEEIYIANKTKHTYNFHFNPNDEIKSHRYDISFSPKSGKLAAGFGETIEVKIKFLCTCKPNEIIDVLATRGDEESGTEEHAAISLNVESSYSTFLDYTEFQKDEMIGEGSFGVVFVGMYRGTKVAIKQTKNFSWPEEVVEAFEKEVRMMDMMRSSYIINFVGAVHTPGHYSIVTEFAECGSLKTAYLNNKFSTELGLKMLSDVAKGMVVLHENNIIHRDLKPDNVLITSMSRKASVNAKLSDFGTSRDVTSSNIVSAMTQGIGTPIYMAPELLESAEYGLPVDVFGYSILCYEVLTRKIPYTGSTFQHSWDVSSFVSEGKRLPILDEFPNEMKTVIAESWDQDPSKRPTFREIDARVESVWKEFHEKHLEEKRIKRQQNPKPPRPSVLGDSSSDISSVKEETLTTPLINDEEVDSTSTVNDQPRKIEHEISRSSLINITDAPTTDLDLTQDDVLSHLVDDIF
ncbi:Protein kinase [Entamoeba marina]